jgi:lipopolysaccharide export system permease protein
VAKDEKGYALQLRDGSLQYQPNGSRFSEISFGTYEIGLDRLTDPIENRSGLAEQDSVSIVRNSMQSGVWDPDAMRRLGERMAEGLRVIAVCLLVFALAGFPHARRARFEFPLELGVLCIAFAERGISTYAPGPAFLAPFSGSAIILLVTIGILINRQFGHLLIARRARPA